MFLSFSSVWPRQNDERQIRWFCCPSPPGARPSRIFARHLRILAFVARGVSVELTLFFPGRTPGPLWRLDSSESTPLPCVAHGFRVVHRWCPLAPSPFLFDALGQSWLCIVFASVERPLLIARRTPGPLQRPELSKSAPLPCVARVRIVYPMKTHMIWIVFICSSNSWLSVVWSRPNAWFIIFERLASTIPPLYCVSYVSCTISIICTTSTICIICLIRIMNVSVYLPKFAPKMWPTMLSVSIMCIISIMYHTFHMYTLYYMCHMYHMDHVSDVSYISCVAKVSYIYIYIQIYLR